MLSQGGGSPRWISSSFSIVCHFPGSSFRTHLTRIMGRMCWADYWKSDCIGEEGQGLDPAIGTWNLADLVSSHRSIQVEVQPAAFPTFRAKMTALSGRELGIQYCLIWDHKWQVLFILEPILTPLHPKQEHDFIDTPNAECNPQFCLTGRLAWTHWRSPLELSWDLISYEKRPSS